MAPGVLVVDDDTMLREWAVVPAAASAARPGEEDPMLTQLSEPMLPPAATREAATLGSFRALPIRRETSSNLAATAFTRRGVMREELKATWRRFCVTRDPKLREQLVCANIELVRRVAGGLARRLPPHIERGDLESNGIPGLLAAVESYDPEANVEFAAFATTRIRGAILDELRNQDPLPRSLREKAREIKCTIARLEQSLMRTPSDEEVSGALGVSLETYHRRLTELRGGLHVSLDERWPEGESGDEHGMRDHWAPDPWQSLALKERRALLGRIIDDLPRNERMVLSLYYFEELTMKEIGEVLEVTESRVSQIHSAALVRIRARLGKRRVGEEDLTLAPVAAVGPGGV
jgi:RNA polymerase sigma factor for flagellar operon FliA